MLCNYPEMIHLSKFSLWNTESSAKAEWKRL